MEKSFLHFKATHPDWQPDPASSVFLDRLRDQVYAGGGGRGFRLEDSRLKERSRSYDRAWAKSSHLLRERLAGVGEVEEEVEVDAGEEDEDEEEGEGGWNRRVDGREHGDEGDEGFLRDVGMVGLLQQVLKR